MAVKVGPLLKRTLALMESSAAPRASLLAEELGGSGTDSKMPIVVKAPTLPAEPGEGWWRYKERAAKHLEPMRSHLEDLLGAQAIPLFAGNAFQTEVSPAQVAHLQTMPNIELLELDPVVQVVLLDDAVLDIDLTTYRTAHAGLGRGAGVTVAVLDSGIDTQHPFLNVANSADTSGEGIALPGSHGTHCAGSIASQDVTFAGVAPDVKLLNVKVLRANGSGTHTNITRGIDEALNLGANVLSMSLGFNHLPPWSQNGHGWTCADGTCPLCTAVNNAVTADNVVVVVAAGNEHERAEALRAHGAATSFDTEISCPGQAREAITVAAHTKQTFFPAPFSSQGPTADGRAKPDIAAPGVNISSTIPAPRDAQGNPLPNPSRADLFGRKSGTSMATPIVAGACALLIEQAKPAAWTPAEIRNTLNTLGFAQLPNGATVIGIGRLTLRNC
jgi:serine protease AprX